MPLLWLSLAFLCGIGLGAWISWPWIAWVISAGVCLSILFFKFLLRRWLATHPIPAFPSLPVPLPVLFAVVCLGAARLAASQPVIDAQSISWYNDRPGTAVVDGILVEPPDERDTYTNLRLQVERLQPPGSGGSISVSGQLLARVPAVDQWQYGDRLRIAGSLQTPPQDETFSYRDYLARQSIYAYMPRASARLQAHGAGNRLLAGLYGFRQRALEVTYQIFPDPEASLLAGILLGIDNKIPAGVQAAFQETGTAHIIAISGFNITLIASLLLSLFSRLLGKRRGAVLAGLGIAFYTILVGAGPSVVRAAIMSGLSLFARQVGRRQHGLNSLALVAGLMCLVNPSLLWDASFQLSFMATLGLVIYADPLKAWFVRLIARWLPAAMANCLGEPAGEFFLYTLAAQLTTLPIMAYHFGRISLIALIANPLILPVQPSVMVLAGLAVLLGMLVLPLGHLAGWLAWPFAAYTIRAVEALAVVPGGSLALPLRGEIGLTGGLLICVYYALLFGWNFMAPRLRQVISWLRPATVLTGGAVLAALVWQAAWRAPDARLHLTVLDVSSGSMAGTGLLIQTPAGQVLLVNGGASPVQLSDLLGRRLSLFNHQLDWLVITGLEVSDIGSLPRCLDRFPPKNVLWSGAPAGTASSRLLQGSLAQQGIPVTTAQAGQKLDLGRGSSLEVRAVGPRGAALFVSWQNFRLLTLTGLDPGVIKTLQADRELRNLTAIFLPADSSAPTGLLEWMNMLQPQVILISAVPSSRALPAILKAAGEYPVLRTDLSGWLDLSTDGSQMLVTVERP